AITQTIPAALLPYLSIDKLGGTLSVSNTAPGPLQYNSSWTYPLNLPVVTMIVNISVSDSALPTLYANGSVLLTVATIRPTFTNNMNATVAGNAAANTLVTTLTATTPYSGATLVYSIGNNGF